MSLHAYAYLTDRYVLCTCGASMGDRYGPMVWPGSTRPLATWPRRRSPCPACSPPPTWPCGCAWAWISAHVVVPFDQILDAVWPATTGPAGRCRTDHPRRPAHLPRAAIWSWSSTPANGGSTQPGLPLPLGVNALRRDLGPRDHRRGAAAAAGEHRLRPGTPPGGVGLCPDFGRGLDRDKADQFVGMYVNDWTLDFGPRGAGGRQLWPAAMPPGSFPSWSCPSSPSRPYRTRMR